MHRLRFAPSPTGYLHVGGARTALFNWLFVKKYGGQFLLRVEDTDKARSTDESTRAIFEGLEWLGLAVGRGGRVSGREPRAPSGRRARAARRGQGLSLLLHAAELDEQRTAAEARGEAFKYDRRCDASARRTRSSGASSAGMPFVIRFRMPEGETSWTDLVHGTITFPNKDIGEGDFIILRSDGTPIYNLAVVSDDIAMRITLVMRGDDHISNTPKQILLYRGARRAAAAVRASSDDSRHGREEAEQASRRDGRRRLSASGNSVRARCSTFSRCSAGRRATTSK